MKKDRFFRLLGLMIVFSLSCNFVTGLTPQAGPPIKPSGKGPEGLTAEATSADSVKLTWQPVASASLYHIAVSIAGGEVVPVMDLDPSRTTYEDFLAMPGSKLTYVVEALSDAGSMGQSVVDVTTPERQTNPLTVEAQLDTQKTASAAIGPEGGSLSLIDEKGVEYKLDIPAGALDTLTNITVTSVKNIGGWPLDGDMLGAVKIEPDGLVLNDAASLSITLPEKQPSNDLLNLGFAFSGTGEEFHLQPAVRQTAKTGSISPNPASGHLADVMNQPKTIIILPITALHGNGIGQGSAENGKNLVKSNSPSDAGAALQQKEAVVISSEGDELAPLPNINPYESILINMAGDVFNTIGKAQDCRETRSAIGSVVSWLWEAKFRGLDQAQIQRAHDTMVKDLADKIKQVIDDAADKCKKQKGGPTKSSPAGTGCAKGLIRSVSAGSTQLFKDIQQQMIKDHGTGALTDPDGELLHCRKAYTVNAPVPSGKISGNICDLEKIFTLDMSGEVSGTFTFFPSDQSGGRLQETAAGAGVTFDGSGTYTISGTDTDSPVMKIDFAETAHTPLGDFTHHQTADLPLDPLEADACQPQ